MAKRHTPAGKALESALRARPELSHLEVRLSEVFKDHVEIPSIRVHVHAVPVGASLACDGDVIIRKIVRAATAEAVAAEVVAHLKHVSII